MSNDPALQSHTYTLITFYKEKTEDRGAFVGSLYVPFYKENVVNGGALVGSLCLSVKRRQ